MSDLLERITAKLDELTALADAATEGPWVAGHVWLRAGVMTGSHRVPDGECAYCHRGEPVQVEPDGDINGKRMLVHTHCDNDPYDAELSISGAAPYLVLVGSGDGGAHISPADAALIRATASPDVFLAGIAEDREVLKRHARDAMTPGPPVCGACSWWEPGAGVEPVMAVPWPCPEVLSVGRRHGIEV